MFPEPAPQPAEPERQELQDLLRRRQQLVAQRVQEPHRLRQELAIPVTQSIQDHIAWLDQAIAQLDQECQNQLRQHRALAQQAALYRSVPGVGPITAATLVAELPELGHRDGKALTALVGLAPWSRDSGQKQGYRSIRGGRSMVRRAVYLAALSAIRTDATLGDFYYKLRQRGKAGKVALVAVMRKLLMHLHAVAQQGTPWVPQPASPTA
jgi:transposase